MLFPGLPPTFISLSVSNLAKDWPKWRQSFEILIVAACDEENLRDRQKLAIFLHCLGRDGRDIVNEWYPQLVNFNSVAAKETTFAQVWNRMNAHCQILAVEEEQEEKETDTQLLDQPNQTENKPRKAVVNQSVLTEKEGSENELEPGEGRQATETESSTKKEMEQFVQIDKEESEKEQEQEEDKPETESNTQEVLAEVVHPKKIMEGLDQSAENKQKGGMVEMTEPETTDTEEIDVEEALDHFKKEMFKQTGSSELSLGTLLRYVAQQLSEDRTVQEYLKRGNLLIIDSLTLNSYPLHKNRDLFVKYGRVTTNLLLRGGASVNALCEFPIPSAFQNLSHLTLSNVKWNFNTFDFKSFPLGLREFKIKHVRMRYLGWMLSRSPSQLESLHVEGVKFEKDFNFVDCPVFPKLKSLTLIRNELSLEGLRRVCPILEYLHLDTECIDFSTKHLPNTVTTLIMRWPYQGIYGLKYLRYLKNLQHLEILEPVDNCHSEDIRSLNLRTVRVAYDYFEFLDVESWRIKFDYVGMKFT